MNPESWPTSEDELISVQTLLAAAHPELWSPGGPVRSAAGCWICHPKGKEGRGAAGDTCWAAAALIMDGRLASIEVVCGIAQAAYIPGLLALREGPLLERAVRAMPQMPEVLLVNATGHDHPRRAGLAVHLGARLSLPTIGVTRRPLIAQCASPADERGARLPLKIGVEVVGYWVRTRRGSPPLAVHAGWRTSPETAADVALAVTTRWRTPEPLRQARRAAREARASGVASDWIL